ncbi:hypothetical protein GCM10027346_32710 [Hymenobacter seoulensis]
MLLGILLMASQCGCPTDPAEVRAYQDVREHVVFANDFEQIPNWISEGSLTTERAHSGRYAVKVDKEHPFSLTYRRIIGDMFTQRPRRMKLSAWVWVEGPYDDALLAFNLNPPAGSSQPMFSAKIYLADNWPYRRWIHVSRDIDLPPVYSSQSQLSIFLWHNTAQNTVYADDWKLTELH